MTKKKILQKIEAYVRKEMAKVKEESHGIKHVERVLKWALKIGKLEGNINLFLLEVAVLLHDVGRAKETQKISHAVMSERMVRKFLLSLNYFSKEDIDSVCRSIGEHSRGGESRLTKILQDADRMDMWGAIAVARTFSHRYNYPYYIDRDSFKLKNLSEDEIEKKYRQGIWEKSCVDGLVNNLSIYNYLNTKTAKKMAKNKVEYLKKFIKQLKKETLDLK